jgi:hypothetical protein
VTATPDGVVIEWPEAISLGAVRITDLNGVLVADLPSAGTRRRFVFPWQPEPGRSYRFEFRADVELPPVEWQAPPRSQKYGATIELPSGQAGIEWQRSPAEASLALTPGMHPFSIGIESWVQADLPLEIELKWSPEVELEWGTGWEKTTESAHRKEQLEFQFDDRTFDGRIGLRTGAETGSLEGTIRAGSSESSEVLAVRLRLTATTAESIERLVQVGELRFPVDPAGAPRLEQPTDEVRLSNGLWRWGRQWLTGFAYAINDFEPVGYQSLELQSSAEFPLNLLIESDITPAGSQEPGLEFAPPRWIAPREVAWGEHLLRLDAGATLQAKLPVFVRTETKSGNYTRRVRVYLLGETEPLAERTAPLRVSSGDPLIVSVTALCLLLVPLAIALAALFGKAWTERIGVEGLALIGLLGGLQLAVSLLARWGGDVLAAVLGPFAVAISGIGNEGLTSLLFAVVVLFVPRVGTFSLTAATVFVLNAMFSGQIGLVDFVFVATSMVWGELALALAGVTSGRGTPTTTQGWGFVLRVGLALGVANAATMFCQYCSVQVLYRLFFAWWYVLAVSVVVGGVYGAVGAIAGARLGQRLRRTMR